MITKLRKNPRAHIDQWATLDSHPILVTDISNSGLHIKKLPTNFKMKEGDCFEIDWHCIPTLAPQKLKLRCVWRKNDEAGMTLEKLSTRMSYFINAIVRYHKGV